MTSADRTLCIMKASDKPVRGGLGGWWHHYTFTDPPRPKLAPPQPSPKPVERRRTDGEIRRVAV